MIGSIPSGFVSGSTGDQYCFAEANEVYAIYLDNGGSADLDLSAAVGSFQVTWFNPSNGQSYDGGVISAGSTVDLGSAPFSGDAVISGGQNRDRQAEGLGGERRGRRSPERRAAVPDR